MDLRNLLECGDVLGRNAAGRTAITLAVNDWLLERLLTFDAGAEDCEASGDAGPDDDAEVNGPPPGHSPAEEKSHALPLLPPADRPIP